MASRTSRPGRLAKLGATSIAIALYLGGCVGGIGDGDPDGKKPTLTPDAEPSETPLKKLSTVQYRNTVVDLLAASGLSAITPTIQPFLDSVPADATDTFRGLDGRVAAEHLSAYYNVAKAVGDAVESDQSLLTTLAGDCAAEATLSASCAADFVQAFGRRVFRRPLTAQELSSYTALDDGTREPPEAIRAMVVTLLMAPAFVNHLELDGDAFAGRDDVFTLTGYELASKLSYTFWQSMPDDELLDAAGAGELDSEEGYAAVLERVFADPRTEATIWQFWTEWLRLDRFTGFSTNRPGFQTLAQGTQIGQPGHDYYADMVQEIRDLTALYTWGQAGTLHDLLTSHLSVTDSADLAALYGVEAYDGSGDYPTFDTDERGGLLQRAALLVNNLEQTNPFHRGGFIRRYVLCDSLLAPNPNDLPPGSLDPPPVTVATTRDRYQAKIEGKALCENCHATFTDIGYVMESFDALGRFRTSELVIDEENGQVLADLDIDVTAAPKIDDYTDESTVANPAELNQRIADSPKAAACLSKQYFTYALRREPGDASGDAALLAELADAEVTLSAMFKQIALHPSFKVRKVGAQ